MRLVADVPFGAFLSGGVDSSIIVAIMSQLMTGKVKTFSINFSEDAFSEAPYARQIAKLYGTEHREILLSSQSCLEKLPEAFQSLDHPSGDGINSYIVSELTKKEGVTMALSGLGGDELFGGYWIFNRLSRLEKVKQMAHLPKSILSLLVNAYKLRYGHYPIEGMIPDLFNLPNWELKYTYQLSRQILSIEQTSWLVRHIEIYERSFDFNATQSFSSKISAAELGNYMADILLRDVDQMSMAHALEVRVPFIDYKLVEYVLGLPEKMNNTATPKKLLIDATKGLLPENIINRKKMGFVFPWSEWMKNEMRKFCEDKINNLAQRGCFNEHEVRDLWNAFLNDSSKVTWNKLLHLIALENWLQLNTIDN
jgi:asparagine synthase (glutamine-hydrolysing)